MNWEETLGCRGCKRGRVFSPNRRLHPTALSVRLARRVGPAAVIIGEGVLPVPRGG